MPVEVIENEGRLWNGLEAANRWNTCPIRAVYDFETRLPSLIERTDVVSFQRLCRRRVAFQHRSKERAVKSDSDVIVIWERQNRNIPPVCQIRSNQARLQIRFKRLPGCIKFPDRCFCRHLTANDFHQVGRSAEI